MEKRHSQVAARGENKRNIKTLAQQRDVGATKRRCEGDWRPETGDLIVQSCSPILFVADHYAVMGVK